jgi:hypothetical protein
MAAVVGQLFECVTSNASYVACVEMCEIMKIWKITLSA